MNKKKKSILLVLGVGIIVTVALAMTYGYWQVTKEQEDKNSFLTACLKIEMEELSEVINMDHVYPLSDEEGLATDGFQFKLTNQCDDPINYIIGLDSLILDEAEPQYLDDQYIKVKLNEEQHQSFSQFEAVLDRPSDVKIGRKISTAQIVGKSTVNHTMKLWLSENLPIEEQEKSFAAKIFVIAGQGFEPVDTSLTDKCYVFDEKTSTILKYDFDCGLDVNIPATVKGYNVKKIGNSAFTDFDTLEYTKREEIIENGQIVNRNHFVFEIYDLDNYQDIIDAIENRSYASESDVNEFFKHGENHTGSQNLNDYSISRFKAYGERRKLYSVNFSPYSQITDIGESAFSNNSLSSLKLPSMLTSIGDYAFNDNSIVNLELPSTVVSIGSSSFENNLIVSMSLPSSLTSLGDCAFSSNNLLSVQVNSTINIQNNNNTAFCYNTITSSNIIFNNSTNNSGQFSNTCGICH